MKSAVSPWIVLAALLPAVSAGSLASASDLPDHQALVDSVSDRMVLVRYVLEQKTDEFGGFSQRTRMSSTGLIVRPDGLVLLGGEIFPDTGDEFTEPPWPVEFEVQTRDGKRRPATLIGRDEERNLAFVKIGGEEKGLAALEFAGGEAPRLGTPLVLVGLLPEKYALARVFMETRVNGVLPARKGSGPGLFALDGIVQDAYVGGPALTRDGRVVGIVALDRVEDADLGEEGTLPNVLTLLAAVQRGKQLGYPVVLPHAEIAGSIASPPPVRVPRDELRAWLGVTLQAVSRDLAEYWKLPVPGGIAITSVVADSPADRAGMRTGDVIVSYDGRAVRAGKESELQPFIREVRRTPIGKKVEVRVLRKGREKPLQVTLTEAPKTALRAEEHTDPDFGIRVRELTFDFAQAMNVDVSIHGVVVQDVENSGWCDVAGIRPGDIILRVNEEEMAGPKAFAAALAKAKQERQREVVFFVQRGADTSFIPVRTDY